MPTQEKKISGAEAMGQVRAIADDVKALREEVQGTTDQLQRFLADEVREHPYRSVLLAFGAGYVLAGGLASSLTREVVRMALRSTGPSLLAAALMKVEGPPGMGASEENAASSDRARKAAAQTKEKDQ
jgi:hypothetical protein